VTTPDPTVPEPQPSDHVRRLGLRPAPPPGPCLGECGRLALICDECRRALALLDSRAGFASISRHPEEGRSCRVCAAGAAAWCVECWCAQVAAYRAELLAAGNHQRATADQLGTVAWQEWPGWWAWGGIADPDAR
jgi:hypothetical protein